MTYIVVVAQTSLHKSDSKDSSDIPHIHTPA